MNKLSVQAFWRLARFLLIYLIEEQNKKNWLKERQFPDTKLFHLWSAYYADTLNDHQPKEDNLNAATQVGTPNRIH